MNNKKIFLLAFISLIQYLIVSYIVLQQFPNSGDEYSYLYQARLFSECKIYDESPLYDFSHPLQKYYHSTNITDYNQKRFSKYPPGWPLLLSVGSYLGIEPAINPILGTTLVFFMLLFVKRRIGQEYVFSTWLLFTFCSFFYLNNGSFTSHTSLMTVIFISFYMYDKSLDNNSYFYLKIFIAGTFIGFAFLIRWLDWIPIAVWITTNLLRRKKIAGLIFYVLGFILIASFQLSYNYLLSDNVLVTPTHLYGAGGLHDKMFISVNGLWITVQRFLELLIVFPPLIYFFVLLRKYFKVLKLKSYLILIAMILGIYYFYIASLGYSYGPRYLFAYFPFVILIIVELYKNILQNNNKLEKKLYKVSVVLLLFVSLGFTIYHAYEIFKRKDLERTVNNIDAKKKIILLKSGTYNMSIQDLTRNSSDFLSANTLYFAYYDDKGMKELLDIFKDSQTFVYEYPGNLKAYNKSSQNG